MPTQVKKGTGFPIAEILRPDCTAAVNSRAAEFGHRLHYDCVSRTGPSLIPPRSLLGARALAGSAPGVSHPKTPV